MSQLNAGSPLFCSHCDEGFKEKEEIVNTNGEVLHQSCYLCAQCFKPFDKTEIYYEFAGRKYCEHDYQVLFAPCCGKCRQFIIGRVIKALNNSWHPNCFNCQLCQRPLADQGFIKNNGRALCHDCNVLEKAASIGRHLCEKCKDYIDADETPLKIKVSYYLDKENMYSRSSCIFYQSNLLLMIIVTNHHDHLESITGLTISCLPFQLSQLRCRITARR